jgi:hypothetical protein
MATRSSLDPDVARLEKPFTGPDLTKVAITLTGQVPVDHA